MTQSEQSKMTTFINFLVNPPRHLQIGSIAARWHELIIKTLVSTKDLITIVPLAPSYCLQVTEQPKEYSGLELNALESDRQCLLQPVLNSLDNIILSLNCAQCTINLFSREEALTPAERKKLENLKLKITLKFRVFEFTLDSDITLQMIKKDRLIKSYSFECKEETLNRKADQLQEIKTKESNKTGEIISDAVTSSMVACMQRFLRVQEEQTERERIKRAEEEKILPEMKDERHKSHRVLFGHRRERRASETDSIRDFGAPFLPSSTRTADMMSSDRPFPSVFPINPSATSSLPPLIRQPGIPTTNSRPEADVSIRSTTSEQHRAIKAVSDRIQSHQSEGSVISGSISSEGAEIQAARNKVKDFLNGLAQEEIFQNVNLQELLQEIVIKHEEY